MRLLLQLNDDDPDGVEQAYEFLCRPPTLIVDEETEEVVLTEHGRSIGAAYGEKHED